MRYADSQCLVKEQYEPEHTYTFIGPCVVTGKEQRVTVKAADLNNYRQGGYVQTCFPYLTAAEREFLISGTSGEGWDIMFPADEEDEEEEDS
jgi:hypothetical protein